MDDKDTHPLQFTRRQALAGVAGLALAGVVTGAEAQGAPAAPQTARGTVFEDADAAASAAQPAAASPA